MKWKVTVAGWLTFQSVTDAIFPQNIKPKYAPSQPERRPCWMVLYLRQPVIIRQVSFNAMSTSFAWAERCQTGHEYSPAEKDRARLVVRSTCWDAPQCDLVSRRSRLFLAYSFCLVYRQWALNFKDLSSITPRYRECGQCSIWTPRQAIWRGLFASRSSEFSGCGQGR